VSTIIHNIQESDYLLVDTPVGGPDGAVAYISRAVNGHYDREAVVALIEALTNAVEAADAREVAEARKLKRGDKVHLRGYPSALRTVVTDETACGLVDVVTITSEYGHAGELQTRVTASQYVRLPN
jgi:hypothetical protein